MKKVALLSPLALVLFACATPTRGPDKTVTGGVLGAAWGAGTGAVVGHQLSYAGEGAAVGAGFGAVSGAAQGLGFDAIEERMLQQDETLETLEVQNAMNARGIESLQQRLDFGNGGAPGLFHVYFDPDATNLRAGSIANLESIADSVKRSPYARKIVVQGHSDDGGSTEYNQRVAEARARSVMAYLANRGVATDQIKVESFGSTRPVTTNATAEGRQMNRRVDVVVMP